MRRGSFLFVKNLIARAAPRCYTPGRHHVGGFLGQRGHDRFSVEHGVLDGVQIVTIGGDADIYASESIHGVFEAVSDEMPLIVDFRACNYIDSSVISTLIRMRKRRSMPVRLVLEKDSIVARVVELTQIGTIMPVALTIEDAKKQLDA